MTTGKYLKFTYTMNNNMHGYFKSHHIMLVTNLTSNVTQMFLNSTSNLHENIYCSKAFLADDNLGDSLDGVEALIRKHEDFDKSFAAQAEKINVSEVLFPLFI